MSAPTPLDPPPGVAGDLARFIFHSSRRPVPEIAIAAALAALAGVCGRAFTISDTGLNLYILLVAPTGAGKETLHDGPELLLSHVKDIQGAGDFLYFGDFGSGPALTKHVGQFPCFVQVCGEFGRKLKSMAADKEPAAGIRTGMTHLYSKSGKHGRSGRISYSDAEKNGTVAESHQPCYSFAGETTPGTFFELLTTNMMSDGFLPRFNIIEYDGPRVPRNTALIDTMSPALLEKWRNLVLKALPYRLDMNMPPRTEVKISAEAQYLFDAFDTECDLKINSSTDEGVKALWNRAHLKALRIAGLLAGTDNPHAPEVSEPHGKWAIQQVRREIESFLSRMKNGDVGSDDHARIQLVMALVVEYITSGKRFVGSYNVRGGMQEAGIVPYTFFQTRLRQKPAFKDHRDGGVKVLNATIQTLISMGKLAEVPKADAAEHYGFLGRCFRICDLKLESD